MTKLTQMACRDLPQAILDGNGKSTGTCTIQRVEPFLCHSTHVNIGRQEQNRLSPKEVFCRGGSNSNERSNMAGNGITIARGQEKKVPEQRQLGGDRR